MSYDCPVPVDKHNSVKLLLHSLTLYAGLQCNIFELPITKLVVNILKETIHTNRGTTGINKSSSNDGGSDLRLYDGSDIKL